MKFCPVCGSLMNGNFNCDGCGFIIDKKDLDNIDNKVKEFLFTENGMKKFNGDEFNKKSSIKLNELLERKLNLGGNINSLTYSTCGGMLGGHNGIYLYFDSMILEQVKQESYYSSTIIKKYKVLEEKIKKINEYIIKYNLPAWSEIAINHNNIVYDVGTTVLYLRYPNNTYEISFNINMDSEEKKIFDEFNNLVFSCINDSLLINTEELKDSNIGMNGIMNIIDSQSKSVKFCPECSNNLNYGEGKCSRCGCIVDGIK